MIVSSIQDAAMAIGVLQRQMQQLAARVQTLEAAAEPDVAAIDEMIARALNGLEKAMAADMGFEDEVPPVRAVSPRR